MLRKIFWLQLAIFGTDKSYKITWLKENLATLSMPG